MDFKKYAGLWKLVMVIWLALLVSQAWAGYPWGAFLAALGTGYAMTQWTRWRTLWKLEQRR